MKRCIKPGMVLRKKSLYGGEDKFRIIKFITRPNRTPNFIVQWIREDNARDFGEYDLHATLYVIDNYEVVSE